MPPFAKPPISHRDTMATDTSIMALSAVHDTPAVLDQASRRITKPRPTKKLKRNKHKRGLRK